MRTYWRDRPPYGYETTPPEKGIRSFQALSNDVAIVSRQWVLGLRLFVGLAVVLYIAVVMLTQSLLVSVTGGFVLLLFRLMSIESTIFERLVLLPDVIIDTHAHDQIRRNETTPTSSTGDALQ